MVEERYPKGLADTTKRWEANDQVVSCDLEGSRALLDLNSSTYFKLNEAGSAVWELLEREPSGLEALVSRMTEMYDVDAEQCRADIESMLVDFLQAGLIAETHGEST